MQRALRVVSAVVSLLLVAEVSSGAAQQGGARLGVSTLERPGPIQDERPPRKEAGTATLLSLLIVGGGQMYAGDTKRGLLMLGSAVGAVVVGAALSSSASCDYDLEGFTCNDSRYTPLYLGALGALGIGIYSVVDAGPTARRMNAKNGYKVSGLSPVFRTGPEGTQQVGLRLAF